MFPSSNFLEPRYSPQLQNLVHLENGEPPEDVPVIINAREVLF
jgi:hypothetical protein